jgi:hypothetical protein
VEQEYYTVKVTISPLDGGYRSRIESQLPHGANFGAGNDFKLDIEPVKQFASQLSAGSLSRGGVLDVGKHLFEAVFQNAVRDKYHELKAIAKDRKLRLRICLALHSPELINIPWELLHDGTNFLVKHGYPIVRILDELVGARSSFAPIRKVLIAAANPDSEDYAKFDAEKHVREIQSLLQQSSIDSEILPAASRNDLLERIRSGGFEALYFVGHGEASELGGRLICQAGANAAPDPLEASDLAAALREVTGLRFVYLNSCSTAKTAKENPFQGVAQRLMLDGDVAAVVAMQVDVGQEWGMVTAKAFFQYLRNKSPEEAMHAARTAAPDDGYSFGIPVLYSYLDAPDQYEKNCLETLLSARPESRYCLVLPSFYLGYPPEEGFPPEEKKLDAGSSEQAQLEKQRYRYPGETFAREDAEAAIHIINLLSRVTPPDQIRLTVLHNGVPNDYTHFFLFGSKSNRLVPAVQKEFQEKFEFNFSDREWTIKDKEYGYPYSVHAPDKLGMVAYRDRDDYGVIQKVRADDRVYFLLAGLGSRATQGCGWYLYRKWQQHLTEKDFAILLKFPGGLDFSQARVIDRKTGKPVTPA